MRVDMLSLAFRPSNRPCMFIHYDSVYFCTCPVVSALSSLAHGSPWQDHFSGASMLSPAPVSETIQQLGCIAPVHLWHCRMVATMVAACSDLGIYHEAQFFSAVVSKCAGCHLKRVATFWTDKHDDILARLLASMKISVDRPTWLGARTHATISNVATPRSSCRLRSRHGRFVKPSSTATLWLRAAAGPQHASARGRQAGPAFHGRLSHVSMPRRAGVANAWCALAVSRSRKPSLTVPRPACARRFVYKVST